MPQRTFASIALAAVLIAGTLPGMAEPAPGNAPNSGVTPSQAVKKHDCGAMTQLNLNSDQLVKLHDAEARLKQDLAPVFEDAKAKRDQLKGLKQANQDKTPQALDLRKAIAADDNQIKQKRLENKKAILTPEQFQKWQDLYTQCEAQRRKPKADQPAPSNG